MAFIGCASTPGRSGSTNRNGNAIYENRNDRIHPRYFVCDRSRCDRDDAGRFPVDPGSRRLFDRLHFAVQAMQGRSMNQEQREMLVFIIGMLIGGFAAYLVAGQLFG